MPITYRIDPERNLVMTEGRGVITDNDLLEYLSKRMNDPLFRSDMKELVDFRDVERDELTMESFLEFSNQLLKYISELKDYRIAIVTTSDLHFGFTRVYMSMMKEYIGDMQVFRDMEEAKTWLFVEDE